MPRKIVRCVGGGQAEWTTRQTVPRTIHAGTPQAFAQDAWALALAREGIDGAQYAALATPWEKTFFFLPLGHSEDLACQERVVGLADRLVEQASDPDLREALAHSAPQARGHCDVIARFGRHPHRDAVVGRPSSPEEAAYVARGEFVHKRPVPR